MSLMIYLNDIAIVPTIFPDRTSQVWKLKTLSGRVRWEFQGENEFMHLAQLSELLEKPKKLYMPYLPYARQDKDISNEKTFAFRVFAKLLNSLDFDEVSSLDPHSAVPSGLIKNFEALSAHSYIEKAIHACGASVVCYPDKGALDKYGYLPHKFIHAEKTRDPATGVILKMEVIGGASGHTVLIVDDICDGGSTFEMLSKKLITAGVDKVCLYVTHGIFSRGTKELLLSGISRIFTHDGEVFGSTYKPW